MHTINLPFDTKDMRDRVAKTLAGWDTPLTIALRDEPDHYWIDIVGPAEVTREIISKRLAMDQLDVRT